MANTGILISDKDGHVIEVGEQLVDFRGETWTVTGWREPLHDGSTGRIYVEQAGSHREFFPGVFDTTFKKG